MPAPASGPDSIRDAQGNPISVGDRVQITATVRAILPDLNPDAVILDLVNPNNPNASRVVFGAPPAFVRAGAILPTPTPTPTPTPAPASIVLEVANRSTVLKDADVQAFAEAFAVQANEHYGPLWNDAASPVAYTVKFVGLKDKHDPANWWLAFLDDSDQASALGYHDVTNAGLPLGKAFAKTAMAAGDSWTVTGSHEGLEMLGDPSCQALSPAIVAPAAWKAGSAPVQVIFENADAVEDDKLGYTIDGLLMSDFVTRAWFNPAAPAGTKFDYRGFVVKPLEILPGGYISYQDHAGNWHQVFANNSPVGRHKHGPAHGSRLARRQKCRSQWRRSTAA